MEKLVIHGGHPLRGHVRVSSAKNAVLPIIVATLLPETPASIVDTPNLDDVVTICSVLESLGVKVQREDNVLTFDASGVNKTEASYELMSRMRASFLIQDGACEDRASRGLHDRQPSDRSAPESL